jgi:hypothetical protein
VHAHLPFGILIIARRFALPPHPLSTRIRIALAASGVVLLAALCCGLPLLIAAGAIGTVGAALGNPATISAASAVLVLAAVAWFVSRRRGHHACGAHLKRRRIK